MTLATLRLAILALAGFAAGAAAALALLPGARERLFPDARVRVSGEARIGGPFVLTDAAGRTVADADFRGRIMLVVFGTTASHGTTTAALQVLSAALGKLGAKAERFVPILIAVDPERDTRERLERYAARFRPRPVALTGTPRQIAQVLRAYRVSGTAGHGDSMASGVDPSTLIYVMGTDGRYIAHLSFAAGAGAMAARLARLL